MYDIMNFGEKHIACVLLVDVSGSMSGQAIQELNEGLRLFGEALQSDSKAYGCADVCVVSFGSTVQQVVPFCPAAEYTPPVLTAGGMTAMNEAIITRGGVQVKGVNPSTMESRLLPGLYFAGEVLDVDALTGGFNLQIAFSTGALAGKSAAAG